MKYGTSGKKRAMNMQSVCPATDGSTSPALVCDTRARSGTDMTAAIAGKLREAVQTQNHASFHNLSSKCAI